MNRTFATVCAGLLLLAAARSQDDAATAAPAKSQPLERWQPAVVDTIATLPLRHGGRIKPLSAFAAETLLVVHGRRDMQLDLDGDKKNDVTLTPTEWLLDVLFFPDRAADFPLFRIENLEVLDAIGVPHEDGQKFNFEYLTYRQLVKPGPGGKSPEDVLAELAQATAGRNAEKLTPVESHIVRTNAGVVAFGSVINWMAPLQTPFAIEGEALGALFQGAKEVRFAELLRHGPDFANIVRRAGDQQRDPAVGNAVEIAAVVAQVAHDQGGFAILPPAGTEAADWIDLPALTMMAIGGRAAKEQLDLLDQLQAAFAAPDTAARDRGLVAFRDAVVARAQARGEYGKVALEGYYLTAEWHYKAMHWFVLALLVVCASWIVPRSKWLWALSLAATALPLCFLVADIVLRCMVQGRPPILRLYDTFLFIAAVGVAAAIVTEAIMRRRVAISLAPIFGGLLILLARKFEEGAGEDQMAPLQAVLDTNYYLATHVTSINMGYAAGMFASFLGTTWLLLNALGIKRNDVAFHKSIVRATYGVTAFGLTFAVFGTIYGGVWANDSWGRFWGWDPKENGALLICIAQVSLLHARMCGWVRDFGFCTWAALTGVVVAFSWFHVNLLNIGLHSYGFNSSTKQALVYYYIVQLGLVVLGAGGVAMRRSRAAADALIAAASDASGGAPARS